MNEKKNYDAIKAFIIESDLKDTQNRVSKKGFHVDSDFKVSDIVYLKNDEDQKPRFITGIIVRESSIQYDISDTSAWHYGFELSKNKNYTI